MPKCEFSLVQIFPRTKSLTLSLHGKNAGQRKPFFRHILRSWSPEHYLQKQPPKDAPRKRCSENMPQIYRRTPMPKCDFNKVAWVFSFKFVAYFQNTFYQEHFWVAASIPVKQRHYLLSINPSVNKRTLISSKSSFLKKYCKI